VQRAMQSAHVSKHVQADESVRSPGEKVEDFYQGLMNMSLARLPMADPTNPSANIGHGERLAYAYAQPQAGGARLSTVIRLVFDKTGVLAEAAIEKPSHNHAFDESALHFSRKVVRQQPENEALGLKGRAWRTHWQFDWVPPQVTVRLLDASPTELP
jgi:hypothetical protein